MAINVSIWSALTGGILSFLSPCVLPLVPLYLCYMSGVSVDDLKHGAQRPQKKAVRGMLFITAVAFVLGFSTVFVILGASATAVGRFFNFYRSFFEIVAGLIIIVMGLNFLGIFKLSLLSREARFQSRGAPATPLGAYIMGLSFAFGWTPCIGPIVLGPISNLAASKETVVEGIQLLTVYSLGLGIPFLLAAMFSGAFMHFLTKFRIHLGKVEKLIGLLLVASGVFFLTGQMQTISTWLLETCPWLGQTENLSWSNVKAFFMSRI